MASAGARGPGLCGCAPEMAQRPRYVPTVQSVPIYISMYWLAASFLMKSLSPQFDTPRARRVGDALAAPLQSPIASETEHGHACARATRHVLRCTGRRCSDHGGTPHLHRVARRAGHVFAGSALRRRHMLQARRVTVRVPTLLRRRQPPDRIGQQHRRLQSHRRGAIQAHRRPDHGLQVARYQTFSRTATRS